MSKKESRFYLLCAIRDLTQITNSIRHYYESSREFDEMKYTGRVFEEHTQILDWINQSLYVAQKGEKDGNECTLDSFDKLLHAQKDNEIDHLLGINKALMYEVCVLKEQNTNLTEKKVNLHTPIDELDLSTMTKNALKQNDINYVGNLVSISEKDLLSMVGIAKRGIESIKKALEENGLKLGMSIGVFSPNKK